MVWVLEKPVFCVEIKYRPWESLRCVLKDCLHGKHMELTLCPINYTRLSAMSLVQQASKRGVWMSPRLSAYLPILRCKLTKVNSVSRGMMQLKGRQESRKNGGLEKGWIVNGCPRKPREALQTSSLPGISRVGDMTRPAFVTCHLGRMSPILLTIWSG